MKLKKLHIHNFKKYQDFNIDFNEKCNIIIGDNEAGKSSILQAIDFVCSGSVRKIESIGLERIFNRDAVVNFEKADSKTFNKLPILQIDLYLNDCADDEFQGKNNLTKELAFGVRLKCEPNDEYEKEIDCILKNGGSFPFEFYRISFSTFADTPYSDIGRKRIKSILIDASTGTSSLQDFIKKEFQICFQSAPQERAKLLNTYNDMRCSFSNDLKKAGESAKINLDKFGLKKTNLYDFENDLMIYDNEIDLYMKGSGRQSEVKTLFALTKSTNNCFVLLEEPENHLSQTNLSKLIQAISTKIGNDNQLFIATHNNEICSRLDLNNVLILGKEDVAITLKDVPQDTARYFMKTPPASLIEFCLSPKVILVEGPAEMILLESFFTRLCGQKPSKFGVNILDVRGLSFNRYLAVGSKINKPVAVITDNDHNAMEDVIAKYQTYEKARVFTDNDVKSYTFEASLINHDANKVISKVLNMNDPLEFMLKNKTEVALKLLEYQESHEKDSTSFNISIPPYIEDAFKWIKEL